MFYISIDEMEYSSHRYFHIFMEYFNIFNNTNNNITTTTAMYKTEEELIWEAYAINEALQDSINQANKILIGNGIADITADDLNKILTNARSTISPDRARYIVDAHLPALALLYVAENDLDNISQEYANYLSIPSLTSTNVLNKKFLSTTNVIRSKKLFQPSDEKTKVIRDFYVDFVEEVHKLFTPEKSISYKQDNAKDIVYEDDNIKVLVADSRLKAIRYGESNLCISWNGANNYYWKYRMGKMRGDDLGMTTYFVTDKSNNNKYVVDSLGDESGQVNKYSYNPINPNTDGDITAEHLIIKHPELEAAFDADAFKFIPYGDAELRFNYIDENINTITSKELKTREDYWMFIESGKSIEPSEWDDIPNQLLKDAIIKYASVGEAFNIPADLLSRISPSDRKNYEANQLSAIHEFFRHSEAII